MSGNGGGTVGGSDNDGGMTQQPSIFDDAGVGADRSAGGSRPRIVIRRSPRRRRTLAARREGDAILVMVPAGMEPEMERRQVDSLVQRVLRKEAREQYPDGPIELTSRARQLAARYIEPRVGLELGLTEVRWVSNQQHRWASCTPATGEIRVSDRMIGFPSWVVDHVLIHELCHLVHADHGPRFKALAMAHPRAEEADGFLSGWSWANSRSPQDRPALDDDLADE